MIILSHASSVIHYYGLRSERCSMTSQIALFGLMGFLLWSDSKDAFLGTHSEEISEDATSAR